jgi:predicted O-methyltransferase YrrM
MSTFDKWKPVVEYSKHIFTWTEPETLAFLAEEASKAQFAVELGSYMGRSAKVMLDANPKLHLWCVDLFMVAGTMECCQHFLNYYIKSGACELIKGDSERAAGMLPHMAGKLDFVFVDDGHATEDVKRDIRCFLPLVRPGGLLCGHDFEMPHNDVALGVIASLPIQDIFFPVPRLWAYRKP